MTLPPTRPTTSGISYAKRGSSWILPPLPQTLPQLALAASQPHTLPQKLQLPSPRIKYQQYVWNVSVVLRILQFSKIPMSRKQLWIINWNARGVRTKWCSLKGFKSTTAIASFKSLQVVWPFSSRITSPTQYKQSSTQLLRPQSLISSSVEDL